MSTNGKKIVGARVRIEAGKFGINWARKVFAESEGAKHVLFGTVCCAAYLREKPGVELGVMWDHDKSYDEHKKTYLRMTRDQPAIKTLRCDKDHVMCKKVWTTTPCDKCGSKTADGSSIFWQCLICKFGLCLSCSQSRWSGHP